MNLLLVGLPNNYGKCCRLFIVCMCGITRQTIPGWCSAIVFLSVYASGQIWRLYLDWMWQNLTVVNATFGNIECGLLCILSSIIRGYVMRDEAGTLAPESSDKNKVIVNISADFCVKTRFMSQLNWVSVWLFLYALSPGVFGFRCESVRIGKTELQTVHR